MLEVLNPVQEAVTSHAGIAPRLGDLSGKVVGLYSNKKLNADRVLAMIAEELAPLGKFTIKIGTYHAEKEMTDAEWGDVDECDVVVLANGDCGACSSSGIVNAIALEQRGIPAFLISTPPFTDAVTTMARLKGMPDVKWAVVEHPIGSAGESELRQRAQAAARQFGEAMIERAQLEAVRAA